MESLATALEPRDVTSGGKFSRWNRARPAGWPTIDYRTNAPMSQSRFSNPPQPLGQNAFSFDSPESDPSGHISSFSSYSGFRPGTSSSIPSSTYGPVRGSDPYATRLPQPASFSPPVTPAPYSAAGMQPMHFSYQPRQARTNLSPTAMEFNASGAGPVQPGHWNSQASTLRQLHGNIETLIADPEPALR